MVETTLPAPVSWGVIGTGDVARLIAQDFAVTPQSRLRAVASRSHDRAQAFAEQFGFEQAYGDVDALLNDAEVQAVYIATPHALHHDGAVQALHAGKHVLVEKPSGIDEREARDLARVAAECGLFAMEAMWMRFNPVYRSLLDAVRRGDIGEVTSVRAWFGIPFPPDQGSRWSAAMHGSTLLDQGIYPLTFARDVLGDPVGIHAVGVVRPDGVDLREHWTLEYSDGRFAQLAASMTEFADPTASVSGTGGWIHVPFPFWGGQRYAVHTWTQGFEPHIVEFPRTHNGYVPMLEAANEAIRNAWLEHPFHPWSDVFATFALMDSVRQQLTREESV